MTTTVYVSIGNSDDKLTQVDWSAFVDDTYNILRSFSQKMHGDWRSESSSPWQNACWCVEFDTEKGVAMTRHELSRIARIYDQDSIAWAVAPHTDFLTPLEEA